MKKIMIALLAIAVLFGFAACDNSNSNTPSDAETPNALDVIAAQYFNGLLTTLDERIESDYATINNLESLSFSIKKTDGVGSTPATSIVVTVTGEDVTADEKATTRTVRLDSWTMNASDILDASYSYSVIDITGLSGALQGTVTIDNTDATAPVISDLQIERMFAPVACTSAVVSIGSVEYDVDTANVLAQISASVPYTDSATTNPLLENYVTEEFYENAMKSVYDSAIRTYVSAALTALALFVSYAEVAKIELVSLLDPIVIIGLFIGAMLPFLFSAMTMNSVGKAANQMIEEVRRQFREKKGIMEGTEKPDYARCVDISTGAALREMIIPGLMAIVAPLLIGFVLGSEALAGMLGGALASGVLLAIMMANAGGAWDNAKKYIEEGNYGGKGSEPHKAAVVGDTVGDPFKDTSGPSINILIKLMTIVAVVFAPLFGSGLL